MSANPLTNAGTTLRIVLVKVGTRDQILDRAQPDGFVIDLGFDGVVLSSA